MEFPPQQDWLHPVAAQVVGAEYVLAQVLGVHSQTHQEELQNVQIVMS